MPSCVWPRWHKNGKKWNSIKSVQDHVNEKADLLWGNHYRKTTKYNVSMLKIWVPSLPRKNQTVLTWSFWPYLLSRAKNSKRFPCIQQALQLLIALFYPLTYFSMSPHTKFIKYRKEKELNCAGRIQYFQYYHKNTKLKP